MIGEITQNNVYLLLPAKVSWLAGMLGENKGMDVVDAIKHIYSSELYRQLQNESTKKWHLGPVDLYAELEAENAM